LEAVKCSESGDLVADYRALRKFEKALTTAIYEGKEAEMELSEHG
jgi:hypothetical protein